MLDQHSTPFCHFYCHFAIFIAIIVAIIIAVIVTIIVAFALSRKVTLSRKHGFSKKAEARLNHLLEKVEQQWASGKTSGVRVSPLNQPPNIKPVCPFYLIHHFLIR